MKHARKDYNRIQDPEDRIPVDEPVFLIRGQDVTAPAVLRYWEMQARQHGADKGICETALKQADLMVRWQKERRMKIPDMP